MSRRKSWALPDTNLARPRASRRRPGQQRLMASGFVLLALGAGCAAGIAVAVVLGWNPLPLS